VTGVGPGKSLENKVKLTQGYVAGNDKADACGELSAFVNKVAAQTGKNLNDSQAASFIDQANNIQTVPGCWRTAAIG
jgi:hypothetical protein